ncbi:hypothetical protein C0J52_23178 [Blattella germanica]|nr:hypothetical protein C0J52_23178 [Blattella germanica]
MVFLLPQVTWCEAITSEKFVSFFLERKKKNELEKCDPPRLRAMVLDDGFSAPQADPISSTTWKELVCSTASINSATDLAPAMLVPNMRRLKIRKSTGPVFNRNINGASIINNNNNKWFVIMDSFVFIPSFQQDGGRRNGLRKKLRS